MKPKDAIKLYSVKLETYPKGEVSPEAGLLVHTDMDNMDIKKDKLLTLCRLKINIG